MANLLYILKEIEEAFTTGNEEKALSMGVKMVHFGWFNRLGWFIRGFGKRFGDNEYLKWFKTVKYVISDMDYYKAKKCIYNVSTKRIFYEYFGINPLAYRYSLREIVNYKNEWKDKVRFRILTRGTLMLKL